MEVRIAAGGGEVGVWEAVKVRITAGGGGG